VWPRGWGEVYLYSSIPSALEGGEWSAARPDRTLPPGKTRYPLYRRLGEPQGWSGRAENLVPTGNRSRTVQPVVSRYTDWAIVPTPNNINTINLLSKYQSIKGNGVATHIRKAHRRSGGAAPLILNLDARWRWVVNFTPRSLYPRERTLVPTDEKVVGPQSWSGRFGEEKCLLPLSGIPMRIVQPVVFRSINVRCQNTINAHYYSASTSAQIPRGHEPCAKSATTWRHALCQHPASNNGI